ncbi:MAG: hypothetical protein ACFFEN_10690 [Candidatus Thorarchaeota archaeon]
MHNNQKDILKDELIKRKLERLRKRSIEDIIQEIPNASEDVGFLLRVVISPADYPYNEQLEFNPNEFDMFFNQLLEKSFSFENVNQPIRFFDPEGSKIDYSSFFHPVIPDKWMNVRKSNEFNSIVIKEDGVLLFLTSQNDMVSSKTMLDIDLLSDHLEILFSQVITEIYKKMNYNGKLIVDIEPFGLQDCVLRVGEPPGNIKLLRDISSEICKSYVLNLQNPIRVSKIIVHEIRRLFEL